MPGVCLSQLTATLVMQRSQFNRGIVVAFESIPTAEPTAKPAASQQSMASSRTSTTAIVPPAPKSTSQGWGGYLLGFVTSSPAIKAEESSPSLDATASRGTNANSTPPNSKSQHQLLGSARRSEDGSDSSDEDDVDGSNSPVMEGLDAFEKEQNILGNNSSAALSRPPLVLYNCVVMVGGLPGNLYVTQQCLWLVFGLSIPGIPLRRESYPLSGLDSITQLENSSLLTANSSKFSFFGSEKVLTISPLAVEKTVLKMVIMAIRDCFHSKYRVKSTKSKKSFLQTPNPNASSSNNSGGSGKPRRVMSKSRSRYNDFKRADSLKDIL
jgi:hypothetical protein